MEYPALNRGLFALFGDIPLLHFPPYSVFIFFVCFFFPGFSEPKSLGEKQRFRFREKRRVEKSG